MLGDLVKNRNKMILAGLAVLALVGTAAAASGMMGAAGEGPWNALRQRHGGHGGGFELSDGTATGRYVTFDVDAQSGALTSYARVVDDASHVIFDSIALASYDAENATQKTRGPAYVATSGEGTRLMAFDARNAAVFLKSAEGNVVTLVVADGIALTAFDAQPGWSRAGVLLEKDNVTARLVLHGNGTIAVDGQIIVATLEDGAGVSFRIDGHPGAECAERHALHKMARHGRGGHEGARRGGPAESVDEMPAEMDA